MILVKQNQRLKMKTVTLFLDVIFNNIYTNSSSIILSQTVYNNCSFEYYRRALTDL